MTQQSYNNNINAIIKPMIVQSDQLGQRLDYALSVFLPQFSRSQIKRWILSKKIIINNKISTSPSKKLMFGEVVEIKDMENNNNINFDIVIPQNIPLNIVYEDNDIVVINKSKNIVVYPGPGNYSGTILNALLYRYPSILEISQRAGIVHRLDKDTTGLMIIAKTHLAYNKLLELFKMRQVTKEYDAVVFGKFFHNTGIINKPIRRNVFKRTFMTVHDTGKLAITRYSVIKTCNIYSRVRIYLETGRTHQIRVHMAYIKHPLIGDQKYRSNFLTSIARSIPGELKNYLNCFNRQALHASKLELLHPVTRIKMKWYAPLPEDIVDLLNILKKNI